MEELICWNCTQRTPAGTCIHCGVELKESVEFAEEEDLIEKIRLIKIRHRGKDVSNVNLDDLLDLVSEQFNVKRELFLDTPKYIIEKPEADLYVKFNNLHEKSNQMVNGLTPKLVTVRSRPDDLLLQYAYVPPYTPQNARRDKFLILFTFLSVFFAGLINYTAIKDAKNGLQTEISLSAISISFESISFGLQFTLGLMGILLLKDYTQMHFRNKEIEETLNSHFIPSPPIFELGTLGSILNQKKIFKTRNTMFYSSLYGPLVGWFSSIALILLTINYSVVNTVAAEEYGAHSIVSNGVVEPLLFKLLYLVPENIISLDLNSGTPITHQLVFHPLTLAGFAGLYISTISFLPASHLNGGFLIRAKYGKAGHIFSTYFILILLIFYHWLASILLLFLHTRLGVPELLNEESPINKTSNIWMFIVLTILVLSIPLPTNLIY